VRAAGGGQQRPAWVRSSLGRQPPRTQQPTDAEKNAGRNGAWEPPQGSVSVFMWSGHSCPLLLTWAPASMTSKKEIKINIEVKSSGQECPLHINLITYWPVPVAAMVCTLGFAESVTVTTLARVPTALGVNVTVNVQLAFDNKVEVHGVVPPGAAA
jgi:hypothetical protein